MADFCMTLFEYSYRKFRFSPTTYPSFFPTFLYCFEKADLMNFPSFSPPAPFSVITRPGHLFSFGRCPNRVRKFSCPLFVSWAPVTLQFLRNFFYLETCRGISLFPLPVIHLLFFQPPTPSTSLQSTQLLPVR